MDFVYFTDNETGSSVAVNRRNVSVVKEHTSYTIIIFGANVLFVKEDYLDVVSRLNNPGYISY